MEPPDAADEHRIRVETLAGILVHVQKVLQHAFGAALRDLTPRILRTISRNGGHLLDVVIPVAAGCLVPIGFRAWKRLKRLKARAGSCGHLSRAHLRCGWQAQGHDREWPCLQSADP